LTMPTEIIKKKVDKSDNTLIDKAAVKFWEKNFPGKDIVTNEEFSVPLKKYVAKKKMYDTDAENENFVQIMLTKFLLLVNPSEYPDKTPSVNFVDKKCVQAAIHVFGPWIQMYEFLKRHFVDPVQKDHEPGPLKVWHGRITKEEANRLLMKKTANDPEGWKSSRKQRYLLRYGVGHLICSNIRRRRLKRVIDLNHERIYRKGPRKKYIVDWKGARTGKTKPILPKWYSVESIASIGGMTDNYTHLILLVDYLVMMRGRCNYGRKPAIKKYPKIRTPICAPGYVSNDTVGAESSDVSSPPVYKQIEYPDDNETTDGEMLNELRAEESRES